MSSINAIAASAPNPAVDRGVSASSAHPAGTAADPAAEARPHPQKSRAVERAAAEIATRVSESNTALRFRLDKDSGRIVVTVVDSSDGTVLRQIPAEEVMRIAKALDRFRANLIEETA